HLADGGGEVAKACPSGPAQEDVAQRGVLGVIGPVVDVERDPPWRAVLIVVVRPGHDHLQVGEVVLTKAAVAHPPRQSEVAHAVGGAPARTAADHATRADGIATARLEVRPRHAPWVDTAGRGHALILALETSQTPNMSRQPSKPSMVTSIPRNLSHRSRLRRSR